MRPFLVESQGLFKKYARAVVIKLETKCEATESQISSKFRTERICVVVKDKSCKYHIQPPFSPKIKILCTGFEKHSQLISGTENFLDTGFCLTTKMVKKPDTCVSPLSGKQLWFMSAQVIELHSHCRWVTESLASSELFSTSCC